MIKNPTSSPFTVTFVGLVPEGFLVNHLVAGENLVGSMLPQGGGIISGLGYTPNAEADDMVYIWDQVGQHWDYHEYYTGDSENPAGWYDIFGNSTAEPIVGVGESFYLDPSGPPNGWSQIYLANP